MAAEMNSRPCPFSSRLNRKVAQINLGQANHTVLKRIRSWRHPALCSTHTAPPIMQLNLVISHPRSSLLPLTPSTPTSPLPPHPRYSRPVFFLLNFSLPKPPSTPTGHLFPTFLLSSHPPRSIDQPRQHPLCRVFFKLERRSFRYTPPFPRRAFRWVSETDPSYFSLNSSPRKSRFCCRALLRGCLPDPCAQLSPPGPRFVVTPC
jgi:hypothetical protein